MCTTLFWNKLKIKKKRHVGLEESCLVGKLSAVMSSKKRADTELVWSVIHLDV